MRLRAGILVLGLLLLAGCFGVKEYRKARELPVQQETAGPTERSEPYQECFMNLLQDLENGIVLGERLSEEGKENTDLLYSVTDVNGDGVDELLLIIRIYGMERYLKVMELPSQEGLPEELLLDAYPDTVFYDNGVAITNWTHNQGRITGSIWPYDLYMFDHDQGMYRYAASATSWKKKEADHDFPDDVDEDKDGEIYCIAAGTNFGAGMDVNTAGRWCDGAAYSEWLSSMLGDGTIVNVEYAELAVEEGQSQG